jgi:hypothetical protein
VVAGFLAGTGVQLIVKALRMSSGIAQQDSLKHIMKHWQHLVLVRQGPMSGEKGNAAVEVS